MTIFAVDFDGTICENKYPEIGELREGAAETIRLMKEHGHTVIIWTCRCGLELQQMIYFLQDHKVPYDRINDHAPELAAIYGGDARKIFADYYIDDHNITPWTWQDVLNLIKVS